LVLLMEAKLRTSVKIVVGFVKTKKVSAFVITSLAYAGHVDVM